MGAHLRRSSLRGIIFGSCIHSAFKHACHVTLEHFLDLSPLFSRQLGQHLLNSLGRGAPCKHNFLGSLVVIICNVCFWYFRVEALHSSRPQLKTLIINRVLSNHFFQEIHSLCICELVVHISILAIEKLSLDFIFFSCHDRDDGIIGGTCTSCKIRIAI